MQHRIRAAVAGLALCGAACKTAPPAVRAWVGEARAAPVPAGGIVYRADTTQSTVQWIGTKPAGRHHGTFRLTDGVLYGDGAGLTGGRFTTAVATLAPDDQKAWGNAMLRHHLLSAAFFDAARHPTATFEITGVQPGAAEVARNGAPSNDATHTVTGNLTLKGASKSIVFPARIAVTPDTVRADASFSIDRPEWGLYYRRRGGVLDRVIRRDVRLTLHVVAWRVQPAFSERSVR